MENFLNSYAFEQMVKEYNKKYLANTVLVQTKKEDEELLLKVQNAFDKVFHLFYLLKTGFDKQVRFKSFFEQLEGLKKYMLGCYKDIFNKEYIIGTYNIEVKNINHKLCANKMLDIFEQFFNICVYVGNGKFEGKNEKNLLIKESFFSIFEKFTKLLKVFYKEI